MSEWRLLQTSEDTKELSDVCWGFHDSTIVGLKYTSGEGSTEDRHWTKLGFNEHTKVHLFIDTSTNLEQIEIEFLEPQLVHLNEWTNDNGLLLDAYLGFESITLRNDVEEPYLFWAPFYEFDPKHFDMKEYSLASHTVIIAKSGRWRSLATKD